jgi:hypothetical protein
LEEVVEILAAHVSGRSVWVQSSEEQGLRSVDVADSRDDPLVEEEVADQCCRRLGRHASSDLG